MNDCQSLSNSIYEEQTHLAERELSAFISAVTERFGPEQAQAATYGWLEESELMDAPPRFTARGCLPGPVGRLWIDAVAIRLYLVERQSAIGPIGHFDWHGPQRRQLFVQWTIWFVRVREPHRRRRNG